MITYYHNDDEFITKEDVLDFMKKLNRINDFKGIINQKIIDAARKGETSVFIKISDDFCKYIDYKDIINNEFSKCGFEYEFDKENPSLLYISWNS